MGILKNWTGIFGDLLQLGGASGPQIRNNSGVFETVASDGTTLVKLRAATPTGDTDVATKYYADSLEKPLVVKRQADCSTARPNNTAVRGWVVVTTAGDSAAIGDVLYDNGLDDAAKMSIVAASEGRTLAITDSLTGGTITFQPDTLYVWDADGSTWEEIGGPGTGATKEIRFTINNSASQDSVSSIPASARIRECRLEITTPYSAGATIAIGSTSTANLAMLTTDNTPQSSNAYIKEQDTAWEVTSSVVRVAVGAAPAAGAGVVTVKYCKPLS